MMGYVPSLLPCSLFALSILSLSQLTTLSLFSFVSSIESLISISRNNSHQQTKKIIIIGHRSYGTLEFGIMLHFGISYLKEFNE